MATKNTKRHERREAEPRMKHGFSQIGRVRSGRAAAGRGCKHSMTEGRGKKPRGNCVGAARISHGGTGHGEEMSGGKVGLAPELLTSDGRLSTNERIYGRQECLPHGWSRFGWCSALNLCSVWAFTGPRRGGSRERGRLPEPRLRWRRRRGPGRRGRSGRARAARQRFLGSAR